MPGADRKWIAFDAAGTLFATAEPVGKVYAECFSRLGFSIPESTWKAAFARAFEITPDPDYPETGNGDDAEQHWWRDLVHNTAISTGIRPDAWTLDAAFEELFDHYSHGTAWKLFPETEAVLSSLKTKGFGMAVVSNFDSRLHRVIGELGISDHFDIILTSSSVGARKPSPAMLFRLMEKTGATPSECCLTGDSLAADGTAADSAGIGFFHIDRPVTDLSDFANWHEGRFFPK